MNKLHYQILALTILIGAPFLVSVATQAIPGFAPQQASVAAAPAAETAPDYSARPPDPMDSLPEPLLPPEPHDDTQSFAMSTEGFSAEPTLDTSGISVDPADNPMPDMASAPPPPSRSAEPMARPDNAPPPEPVPNFREGMIPRG